MGARSVLGGWDDVERIRDEGVERMRDQQSTHNNTDEQAEASERLIR